METSTSYLDSLSRQQARIVWEAYNALGKELSKRTAAFKLIELAKLHLEARFSEGGAR